jgi:hypothetical protein
VLQIGLERQVGLDDVLDQPVLQQVGNLPRHLVEVILVDGRVEVVDQHVDAGL